MLKLILLLACFMQAGETPAPKPLDCTVRIRAMNHSQPGSPHAFFSGTVIQSDATQSTVLTCSHGLIWRTDDAPIKVDLFNQQPDGTFQVDTTDGQLIAKDHQFDLAAIVVHPGRALPFAAVMPKDRNPDLWQEMTVAGCRHGGMPDTYDCQVIGLDMILSPVMGQAAPSPDYHGIVCTRAASKGRSGGGLFDARGTLCGVLSRCSGESTNWTDPKTANSVYANSATIHTFLERHNLTHVLKRP